MLAWVQCPPVNERIHMIYHKGIRFRLYPNKEQRILMAKTFGCCRLIYNKGLALRKDTYKATGHDVYYKDTSKLIHQLSLTDEYSFLKEVSSVAMQQSLRDLDNAYDRFFKHLGNYPRFKKKSDNHKSFRIVNQKQKNSTFKVRIVGNYIHIPTLGYVKFKQSMPVDKINNITIEQTPSGKYYVVINTESEWNEHDIPYSENMIGIDVGIKSFLTDTNGDAIDNPKWFRRSLKRLRREQRKLSRMIERHITGYKTGLRGGRIPMYDTDLKECSNIQKQRKLIARIYEKITNQRNDFQQKLSTRIVKENQFIGVEHLNIKGMKRNSRLSLSLHDAAWGNFIRMLEYKARWYGRTLIKVPTFYPSSQTCHTCGYKNSKIKDLSVREWICPKCGAHHDRDSNAADNILAKALEMAAAAV